VAGICPGLGLPALYTDLTAAVVRCAAQGIDACASTLEVDEQLGVVAGIAVVRVGAVRGQASFAAGATPCVLDLQVREVRRRDRQELCALQRGLGALAHRLSTVLRKRGNPVRSAGEHRIPAPLEIGSDSNQSTLAAVAGWGWLWVRGAALNGLGSSRMRARGLYPLGWRSSKSASRRDRPAAPFYLSRKNDVCWNRRPASIWSTRSSESAPMCRHRYYVTLTQAHEIVRSARTAPHSGGEQLVVSSHPSRLSHALYAPLGCRS
jgi:hypothetical protein